MSNKQIETPESDAVAGQNYGKVISAVKEYDPNDRWHPQTVQVELRQWDYSKVIKTEVGGNCLGFDIFDAAIENIVEALPTNKYGAKEVAYVVLERGNGDTLLCEDEEDKWTDWLKEMIVSISIINVSDKPQRI